MASQDYNETRNMGLPTDFKLVAGKFALTGGTEKVDDNMRMMVAFIGWFRLFLPDFVFNVLSLYQRTSNFIIRYKNFFRLNISRTINKYAPNVDLSTLDILTSSDDRKALGILLQYKYKLDKKSQYKVVNFVKAL